VKLRKSYVGAGALAIGAVLAFALPAGAAVNLQSESGGGSAIKIVKNAQLKAKGAATIVTVSVACPTGSSFDLDVSVTQAVSGNKTTSGSGNAYNQACTGGFTKVKVAVPASPAPFKKGVAYAIGEAHVWNLYSYQVINTGREIVNVES
jgi:hypothetical protein